MDNQQIIKVLNKFNEEKSKKNSLLFRVLHDSKIIFDFNKEKNEDSSFMFNPLNYFFISEPLNSKMIADLLNPHEKHGQGKLFLNLFLKKLGFEINENDHWDIRAESERLDISLVCNNPYRVIIIENKVNGAIDQQNQLYRYYELKIKKHYKVGENCNNKLKILYLTKTIEKVKAKHVLESYDGTEKIPSELIVDWTFDKHIVEIFKEAKENEKLKNNIRLKTYLDFFIEYSTK